MVSRLEELEIGITKMNSFSTPQWTLTTKAHCKNTKILDTIVKHGCNVFGNRCFQDQQSLPTIGPPIFESGLQYREHEQVFKYGNQFSWIEKGQIIVYSALEIKRRECSKCKSNKWRMQWFRQIGINDQ